MQILKNILQSKYLLLIILLIMMLISYWRINLVKTSKYHGREEVFKLKVTDKKYDTRYTITFEGKEKLISYVDEFSFDVGDILYVNGSLSKPRNNTIFNTFNYQSYLQSRGILWELNIRDTKLIEKNRNIINKLKSYLINRINTNQYKEYLYVYLLGETSYFSNKRDIYDKTGLSYLISIGSLQIMMIINLLKKIEGRLRVGKKHSLIVNIIVILAYIIFTRGRIGVLRSGLCYITSNVLKYFRVKYKYYNIICMIGIILLLINPYNVSNIGFLYSFTISIILSYHVKLIKGSYFKRLLIISLIAFISSLPITVYFNYEINFLSFIYSLLFIPVFHFVIFPLSIIVFIFSFLSPVYYFIISFIEYIISYLSRIDILLFAFKKPSMIVIVIYYLVIICTLSNRKYIVILLMLLIIHININKIIKEDIVTFLDVGQGDSIVIKHNNHLFLLDTGGNWYSSRAEIIIKYIKSLGIGKIENLIISHGDFDHMGDAINLVNNIKIDNVIFNCGPYETLENELINELNKNKINYSSCINKLDNLIFLKTKEYDNENENDNSNVIYTELNGYKFLFMGDASVTTEKEIMNKYNLSDIDVLKVGHHGSKTSSGKEFINEINPKYSIISVGKNNRYGHPNKEVLENLNNSKIYRTDEDGSIMFKIKNNKLKIETCSP